MYAISMFGLLPYLMLLHFLADFLFQSREMGRKKSEEFVWLVGHMAIIFFVFFIGLMYALPIKILFILCTLNTILHGIIDGFIWKVYKLFAHKRIVKELRALEVYGTKPETSPAFKNAYAEKVASWKYWEDPWFYTTIGFDQFLHMICLVIVTYLCYVVNV